MKKPNQQFEYSRSTDMHAEQYDKLCQWVIEANDPRLMQPMVRLLAARQQQVEAFQEVFTILAEIWASKPPKPKQ